MNVGEAEMIDRKKVIETLWDWHYRVPGCTDEYDALMDAIALLKEQEDEKKRIMKVIWDTLHEGLSIDTVADQDWVYEQIRHRIEDT